MKSKLAFILVSIFMASGSFATSSELIQNNNNAHIIYTEINDNTIQTQTSSGYSEDLKEYIIDNIDKIYDSITGYYIYAKYYNDIYQENIENNNNKKIIVKNIKTSYLNASKAEIESSLPATNLTATTNYNSLYIQEINYGTSPTPTIIGGYATIYSSISSSAGEIYSATSTSKHNNIEGEISNQNVSVYSGYADIAVNDIFNNTDNTHKATANSSNNELNITGEAYALYGGYSTVYAGTSQSADSEKKPLFILTATSNENVVNFGDDTGAEHKAVSIIGGWANSASQGGDRNFPTNTTLTTNADWNTVQISGATVTENVVGGQAAPTITSLDIISDPNNVFTSSASYNKVKISNSNVKNIIGGFSTYNPGGSLLKNSSSQANHNTITTENTTIKGDIYGGISYSENPKATNNIVNIKENTYFLDTSTIWGGHTNDILTTGEKFTGIDIFSHNQLNKYSTENIPSVRNFNTVNINYEGNANISTLYVGQSSHPVIKETTSPDKTTETTTINTNDNDVIFDGKITGTGALGKSGTGVLTLTQANNYTGGTKLTEGELKLTNAKAAGEGAIGDGDASTTAADTWLRLAFGSTFANSMSGRMHLIVDGNVDLSSKTAAHTGMTTLTEGSRLVLNTNTLEKSSGLTMFALSTLDNSSDTHVLAGKTVNIFGNANNSSTYIGDFNAQNSTLNFFFPATLTETALLRIEQGNANISGSTYRVFLPGGTKLEQNQEITLMQTATQGKSITANSIKMNGDSATAILNTIAKNINIEVGSLLTYSNLQRTAKLVDNNTRLVIGPGGSFTSDPDPAPELEPEVPVEPEPETPVEPEPEVPVTPQTPSTPDVQVHPGGKSLLEGQLAGMGLLIQGADLVAGAGMRAAMTALDKEQKAAYAVFGTMSGASLRYNTGSHIHMNSLTLLTGVVAGTETFAGRLAGGLFFEYGKGHYKTSNSFNNTSINGNGHVWFAGAGLLARMDFLDTGPGHFYLEASGRAGALHNDYDNSDLRDGLGRKAEYASDTPYHAFHAGLGYEWDIADNACLDLYTKYFYSHQYGESLTLSTGEALDLDDIFSQRLRFGVQYNYDVNDVLRLFIGAAYEHEFDGKARGSANGYGIAEPSFKGDTGIGELGITLTPFNTHDLTIDLSVQGYVGRREGVTGSFLVKYEF